MIGDVLKRTRAIYGLKATEMSELLEISKSYLSEIENNKKKPSLELLEKYSKIYGIKLSSLICSEIHLKPFYQTQTELQEVLISR